jgi:hypothetical protein
MKFLINILIKLGIAFTFILGILKVIGFKSSTWLEVFMPLIVVVLINIAYSLLSKILKIK